MKYVAPSLAIDAQVALTLRQVCGLLALMLLQDSQRNARTDANDNLVLLEDQNSALWQQIDEGLGLVEYHLTHAARADFFRRLGHTAEARLAYEQALRLTKQEPERRFLQRRLNELK